jgi:branched-subunit amino acid ABC-type transport system permease component
VTVFLTYTALGLVVGAIYSIAACGLVLTYNTSGVFNFAHGAQAMIGAFVYYQVNTTWGVPAVPSVILVIGVLGPGMGILLHRYVMKGLGNTEAVTRIVVTVAIMLGLVRLSQSLWPVGGDFRYPRQFFAGHQLTLFHVTLTVHEVLCLVIALALAVVLRVLFTRTRLGLLMRATVDDPDLLRLAGHDPERASALAWMLGSTLAVLAGVLITPINGTLEANILTLIVADAFAAALFGRLRNIPLTFVGAIVVGLGGSYFTGYAPGSWWWAANLAAALPMVLLFLVLLFLPHDRLRTTALRSRERYEVPPTRRAAMWGAAFVVITFLLSRVFDEKATVYLIVGIAFAIIALSVTLLTGYAGETNLAPLAFAAVATIVAFHVGAHGVDRAARLTLTGVLAGTAVAAVVGAIVALPALRLRGLYLALATFAFGIIVSSTLLQDIAPHSWFGHQFTSFPQGSVQLPLLEVGWLDFGDRTTFLVSISVLFAVLGVGVVALRNGSFGRRLAAMKDSPAAAATLGQRLLVLKLSVFTLSTAIAGLGGIFMAMAVSLPSVQGRVSADSFGFVASLSLVMLVVVGGIGYVSGALFSGIVTGVLLLLITLPIDSASAYAHARTAGTDVLNVGAALIGVLVARNPSGLARPFFAAQRRLDGAREARWAAAGVQVVLYVLAYTGVLTTVPFLVLSAILWLVLPSVAGSIWPERVHPAGWRRPVPPELVGVDDPYPPDIAAALDKQLGLSLPKAETRLVGGDAHVTA